MPRNTHNKNTIQKSFVLDPNRMGKKVVHGASFTFLGMLLRTLITFGAVAILARLLTPADFGYIAMATIITEFAALFGNFGFSSVLIQRRVITRLQIDTVFWSSLLLGILLTGIVFVLSFFASWFFREPIAGELIRFLSVMFVIDGLTVVHTALISRLMQFGTDFWIQLAKVLIRACSSIFFAWNGFGVWSLVWGSLLSAGIESLLYGIIIPYWPRLRFNKEYLISNWKTNASYFGGGVLFYINSNVDLLIIGRSVGASALGYYQNARSLTDEVRARLAIPLQRVLFPAYSALQNDIPSLQAAVMKSGRLLSTIIFPVGIGIAAIADDLVPVLYGEQWLAMIPVLKFLGISICLKGSTTTATPIFNSQNRVALGLRYNIIGVFISVICIAIASRYTKNYGIEAVAMAVVFASFYSIISFKVALGLIGLGWVSLCSMIFPQALAAILMWEVIEISRCCIINLAPSLNDRFLVEGYILIWHIFIGAMVYPLVLIAVSPSILNDMKLVLKKFSLNK